MSADNCRLCGAPVSMPGFVHSRCNEAVERATASLRAENVRLAARVAEVEAQAEAQDHGLCMVIDERTAVRDTARAEVESLKAQLAERQRERDDLKRLLDGALEEQTDTEDAERKAHLRAESAEEQLRVAREALESLRLVAERVQTTVPKAHNAHFREMERALARVAALSDPAPKAEACQAGYFARTTVTGRGTVDLCTRCGKDRESHASAPKAEPILDEDGEWSGPSEHAKHEALTRPVKGIPADLAHNVYGAPKAEPPECEYSTSIGVKCPPDRAALMRVAEKVMEEVVLRLDGCTSELGDLDLAAIVAKEAP